MIRTAACGVTPPEGRSVPARRSLVSVMAGTLVVLSTTGCSYAPTFNILGSYFPSWILCCALAALVTFAAHAWFAKTRLVRELWPLPLVYTALFCLVSCTVWLLFFA